MVVWSDAIVALVSPISFSWYIFWWGLISDQVARYADCLCGCWPYLDPQLVYVCSKDIFTLTVSWSSPRSSMIADRTIASDSSLQLATCRSVKEGLSQFVQLLKRSVEIQSLIHSQQIKNHVRFLLFSLVNIGKIMNTVECELGFLGSASNVLCLSWCVWNPDLKIATGFSTFCVDLILSCSLDFNYL
jgi:hypothetical protein